MTPYRDLDEDEWEGDGEAELEKEDDSDEEPTVPCPHCGREIREDSPRCPACERYISDGDHAGTTRPLWVVATAVVLLGIAIWWTFTAF